MSRNSASSSSAYRTTLMPAGGLRSGIAYSIDALEAGTAVRSHVLPTPPITVSRKSRRRSALLAVFCALLVAAAVAGAVYFFMHRHSSSSSSSSTPNSNSAPVNTRMVDSNVAAAAPFKYAVSLVPPRKVQYNRGTCWDFALVALIEHQYRMQGVASGLLKPEQYLEFSEQAFGYKVLQFCKEHQELCLPDGVAFGTTEGGDNNLLYSFRNQFKNALLPTAVCPYVQDFVPNKESCDNAPAALAHNPIQVEVTGYNYYIDVPSIKAALSQSGRAMDMRIPIHYSFHYLPCDAPMAGTGIYAGACPATPADPCPDVACPQSFRSKCCVRVQEDSWSFTGVFRGHGEVTVDGSHTMLLTGYNDEFITEAGQTGGFILRNSWMDSAFNSMSPLPDGVHAATRTRGSHSMAYFMNKITAQDERMLCPNSADPRNWYNVWSVNHAMNPLTTVEATGGLQPLHLRCVARNAECQPNPTIVYFAMGFKHAGDGLYSGKFLEVNTMTGATKIFTLPPRIIDTFAWVFLPFENETRQNDPDFCGFYFWPYDLMRRDNAQAQGLYVIDYQLSFAPQSYLANAAQFADAHYDYTYMQQSMRTQKSMPVFDDVFPNDIISGPAGDKTAPAAADTPAAAPAAKVAIHSQHAQQAQGPVKKIMQQPKFRPVV